MSRPAHLITLGFAKSGTTLLHRMFAEHSPLVVPKRRKEIKYFAAEDASLEGYLEHFARGNGAITFESSPQYLTAAKPEQAAETMRRIKTALGDVKVLICLRQPVDRAFSHYLHNLQFFSRFGHRHSKPKGESLRFKRVYARGFEEALRTEENIGTLFHRKCNDALDIFGPEACRFFLLERDSSRPKEVAAELSSFLELGSPLQWTSFARVYSGLRMPRYVFGGAHGRTLRAGGRAYGLAPESTFVACDMENLYLTDLSRKTRAALERSESLWTRELSASAAAAIYEEHFRDDFERTLALAETINKDPEIGAFYAELPPRGRSIARAEPDPDFAAETLPTTDDAPRQEKP